MNNFFFPSLLILLKSFSQVIHTQIEGSLKIERISSYIIIIIINIIIIESATNHKNNCQLVLANEKNKTDAARHTANVFGLIDRRNSLSTIEMDGANQKIKKKK